MFKKLSLFLVLALLLAALAGCTGTTVVVEPTAAPVETTTETTETTETTTEETTSEETTTEETTTEETADAETEATADASTEATSTTEETATEEAAAEGKVFTGLYISENVAKSASATAETEGKVEYDVTVAAVTIDENGVILSCEVDTLATTVKFDATGAYTTDLTAELQTKGELGYGYNMKAYAGSAYEWFEQIDALEEYVVGKTVEELKTGAVTETGHAADADLATTATITIGGYIDAIIGACENAQEVGAQAGDELHLAITANLTDSTAATAEKEGTAQLYLTAAAVTMDGETITGCVIDAIQVKVSIDATGVITTDLTADMLSKNELGDAYNMKAYGGAKFEWYEQAANFAAYITGKTPADVAAIAVNEKTAPTDADLTATVTIKIGEFQKLIAKVAA